jgi:hypothetical protein
MPFVPESLFRDLKHAPPATPKREQAKRPFIFSRQHGSLYLARRWHEFQPTLLTIKSYPDSRDVPVVFKFIDTLSFFLTNS